MCLLSSRMSRMSCFNRFDMWYACPNSLAVKMNSVCHCDLFGWLHLWSFAAYHPHVPCLILLSVHQNKDLYKNVIFKKQKIYNTFVDLGFFLTTYFEPMYFFILEILIIFLSCLILVFVESLWWIVKNRTILPLQASKNCPNETFSEGHITLFSAQWKLLKLKD